MNSAIAASKRASMSTSRQLAISGLVMAGYIAAMLLTQGVAFGQYQIRLATALYALSALHPFLIIPLAVANMLSNLLLGGLGLVDAVGGGLVGLATATLVQLVSRWRLNDWAIAVPIIFCPGLLVPVWLSYLLGIPYGALAVSLVIGQIVPAIAGVILVKQLRHKL
ncbi:MAG: QueT transporter family protein [Sporomusaceae bacterium]|nr:QueT transporter family protein [Sporomusaceae bacterium]